MRHIKMYQEIHLQRVKQEKVTKKVLSEVGRTFQKINGPKLRAFLRLQDTMTGVLAGASLKTYNNSKVRMEKR